MRRQGKIMLPSGHGGKSPDVYTMQNFEAFRSSPSPGKAARRQSAVQPPSDRVVAADGGALAPSLSNSFAYSIGNHGGDQATTVSISLTPPRIGSSPGVPGNKGTSFEKLMRDRLVQQREGALKLPVSPLTSPSHTVSATSSAVSSVSPGARVSAVFFSAVGGSNVHGDEDSVHSDLSRDYELAKENAVDNNRGGDPSSSAGREGSVAESSTESSGADAAWWSRLSRVAEGREKADPAELRAMLKTVVNRAEESIISKGGGGAAVTAKPDPPAAAATRRASVALGPLLRLDPHLALEPHRRGSTGGDPHLNGSFPVMSDDAKYRASVGAAPSTEAQPNSTVFEKEAQALQVELAQMQKTLQERMLKYQKLVRPS